MANFVCSPARAARLVHRLGLTSFVSVFFAAGLSAQTTVTLSTPRTHINVDTTIQGGGSAHTDFSWSDVLATKVSSEAYTRRIMMKFDTETYVPAGVVVDSAYLYLVLKKAENGENRPLTAYYVNRSFVAGETNWRYFRSGQAWATAGGDLGSSFGTTYVGNAVGSTYRFDLTNLVQRTVRGEFGSRYTRLSLVDVGAASAGNYREFHSTRAADPSLRPRLVITYRASGTPTTTTTTNTGPAPAPAPSTSTGGTTLRVMQWNIHKTKGGDDLCNPDRTASVIAAQRVDVVSLNEVNFFSGTCAWDFDMGERLRSLVQQKTGVTWHKQHVNAGGVGNVLLSRHQPVSSTSTLLSYQRGVAQMTLSINGQHVNVFSTHVEYFTAWWRPIQIREAVQWMGGFGPRQIVMGDFNTWPDTSDYQIVATPYQDAWVAAQSAGTATAYNGTGATHGGTSRLDYVFHERSTGLSLQSVNVPDSRVNGVTSSDHDPVVAVYTVR
ncbi:MAG TPA: endonuclease/exonuclease/phosphatase family protein [Vicinamibacterales bacterium]|jgi:endonuclease/exonuclease/phosphatase family metal-dependent hydrolase|nr:endonuclease/exonuclease/phosphatase family protein [Vicinamibacterales bacterium]